eukprot:1189644-Prorocentrum_minimum.AAC.1
MGGSTCGKGELPRLAVEVHPLQPGGGGRGVELPAGALVARAVHAAERAHRHPGARRTNHAQTRQPLPRAAHAAERARYRYPGAHYRHPGARRTHR